MNKNSTIKKVGYAIYNFKKKKFYSWFDTGVKFTTTPQEFFSKREAQKIIVEENLENCEIKLINYHWE